MLIMGRVGLGDFMNAAAAAACLANTLLFPFLSPHLPEGGGEVYVVLLIRGYDAASAAAEESGCFDL